ncbi:hypothetical protein [Citrifermentans bremense]|uniref:hypothetical protein n=1 Tax=Citrifermentans bremense TaxID=60035 RepID=UPI0006886EE6|nr:hypothetical protein [Citrifermentans bremense]
MSQIQNEAARIEKLVMEEGMTRQQTDDELLKKLKKMSVDDVGREIAGFAWLLIGMLIATIPEEIARWVPECFAVF